MQTSTPPNPVARKSRRRWHLVGGFVLLFIATKFAYHFVDGALLVLDEATFQNRIEIKVPNHQLPIRILIIPSLMVITNLWQPHR